MARVNATITPAERDTTRTLLTAGATITALYFGKEVFVPIALAILLSFVLAPGVRKLHALGLGRIFPVIFMSIFAFTIIFSLAGLMASQLRDVAADLPRYEDTMTKKIAAMRGATNGGALQHLEETVSKLDHAMNKGPAPQGAGSLDQGSQARAATGGNTPSGQAPIPVELEQRASSPMETIGAVLGPLIHPLATTGIVVIFVIFILAQREDLRNRLIRLFGASDLQRTTEAINDGAKRLSRYLLTQSLLNATTGVVIGFAAYFIGVPNPVLWGILFACMRFIPYIGPILGGGLPALFAAAVDPGWSVALWMAGTVLAVEMLVGQVLEPLLYGHNTGLSPVAVVVSATFWTALWGPVGLLLSTPLTVCLVVVGRHVEQLEFLDVLLGDRPPLSAPESFYQRMLANDPTEVFDQAQECLKTMSLTDYYDHVLLPGLLLAQGDATAERLTVDRQIQIRDATEEVIEDLGDEDDAANNARPGGWRTLLQAKEAPEKMETEAEPAVARAWQAEGAILCIGARGPLDDCVALMLAQVLGARGLGVRAADHGSLSKAAIDQLDISSTKLICLSCLDGSSSAYLRFALRRVRRHAPRAKVLIGAWWKQTDADDTTLEPAGERAPSEPVATTIIDAARFCLAAASALTEDELSSTDTDEDNTLPVAL